MRTISKTGILVLLLTLAVAAPAQDRAGLPLPGSGNVTLPLDEFNRLVELASQPAKKSDAPPFPYAIQSAALKLQVVGEAVSGTVQMEGEVFGKGPVKVPLFAGMAISDALQKDAQQKGLDLPLQQEGGTHVAVLPGPAGFSLTLNAGLPVNIEAGRASFTLPVPAAGTVRLTLTLPGDRTRANISPGLITARASNGGSTTIEATLVPGQPAGIWWATRETVAPPVPREVRFLSDVKTLVTVNEAELAMAALVEITVVQGEPAQFELAIPPGYEVTGATGATLESSEVKAGESSDVLADVLVLKVSSAALRGHQFLISMTKPVTGSKAEVPFLSFKGAQRETGEALVEAQGTMELNATEGGGLKRMDLKEISPYLRSLAHYPLQAAFRYHRQPAETPGLALEWVRFPDSSVLAAVAQQAVVTTLVTSEGRSLTEVKLVIRNQAQPFLKVALPAGAGILSADVAGVAVKPMQAPDGNRVPLLRPGFRSTGAYEVSFVFMHSGTPFARKGGSDLTLPKMDIPIGLMQWEVFLPEQYKVKDFGGDAISAALLPPAAPDAADDKEYTFVLSDEFLPTNGRFDMSPLLPGQLGGTMADPSGSVIPGVQITIVHSATGTTRRVVTDSSGRWLITNMPSGRLGITADARGFQRFVREIDYDASRPSRLNFALQVGSTNESVMVTAADARVESAQIERQAKQNRDAAQTAASVNVLNLQRRVAGVLPIKVDVPRAGNSYRFVRPLVLDEETRVTFAYKTR